jgi:hypothetical protein
MVTEWGIILSGDLFSVAVSDGNKNVDDFETCIACLECSRLWIQILLGSNQRL